MMAHEMHFCHKLGTEQRVTRLICVLWDFRLTTIGFERKNILGNKDIYSHSFHGGKLNECVFSVCHSDLTEHMSELQGRGEQGLFPIIISRRFLSLIPFYFSCILF